MGRPLRDSYDPHRGGGVRVSEWTAPHGGPLGEVRTLAASPPLLLLSQSHDSARQIGEGIEVQRPRPISTASPPTSSLPKVMTPYVEDPASKIGNQGIGGRIEEGFAFYSPAKRVPLKPHQFSFDSTARKCHFPWRQKMVDGPYAKAGDGSMTAHPTSPRATSALPFLREKLKKGFVLLFRAPRALFGTWQPGSVFVSSDPN